jgi:DNA-binding transcriptional regulator of glucitol operon
VRRVLLSPWWLLGHVLALAAAVVCVRLGWWQWHRAQQTHSIQNLGYAVQWPAFGAFILLFWLRVIRDHLRPPQQAKPRSRPVVPTAAPPPLSADDPEDAKLIAYNDYLRRLHEQDQKAR